PDPWLRQEGLGTTPPPGSELRAHSQRFLPLKVTPAWGLRVWRGRNAIGLTPAKAALPGDTPPPSCG
ncbi:hypothetical protein P7K49_008457, partial [Saguinus oedipus]